MSTESEATLRLSVFVGLYSVPTALAAALLKAQEWSQMPARGVSWWAGMVGFAELVARATATRFLRPVGFLLARGPAA